MGEGVLAKLSILLWVLVLVWPAEARGEAERPGAMTLEQAVAFGRAHQPQALAALAKAAAARQEAAIPGAQWRPVVGAFAEVIGATVNNSTATPINMPGVDIPRVGATPLRSSPDWTPYPSSALAVGIRQTLLDFGQIRAESDALRAVARAEEGRAEAAVFELEWRIALAFYDVLAARASVGVAERALARAKARRELVEAATSVGVRPASDRPRAEADVARFEAVLVRARGASRLARMQLAAAIGSPAVEVDAQDPPPPTRPLRVPEEPGLKADLEARDPSLRAAREQVLAQEAATRALAAATRPRLFATGGVTGRGGGATPAAGGSPPGVGFLPLVPNFHLGLVLTFPIYDPVLAARVEASRAREAALRHELEAVRLQQLTAARQSLGLVRVTDEVLPAIERSASAAAANAEQAEARYKVGLGTVTEVAEAEALRVEAELLVVLARFDARRARASLKQALSDREASW
jgi:outer membrane protein TolC